MRNIRLNNKTVKIIREAFIQYFLPNDKLWLFGSRADLERKGGDIDLYVETHYKIAEQVNNAKGHFWSMLQDKLGEQKIDIIMHALELEASELPVYRIAKANGIQLVGMKTFTIKELEKLDTLKSEIEICDIHTQRIQGAMEELQCLGVSIPLQVEVLERLDISKLALLELITNRFAKLQDTIGYKIFPLILDLLGEKIDNASFIDRLNLLEKREILDSAEYWRELREVRNLITHEYPNQPILMTKSINAVTSHAFSLLTYWSKLKNFIEKKFF